MYRPEKWTWKLTEKSKHWKLMYLEKLVILSPSTPGKLPTLEPLKSLPAFFKADDAELQGSVSSFLSVFFSPIVLGKR